MATRELRGSRRRQDVVPPKVEGFSAAYAEGVERLAADVEAAAGREHGWADRLSAGLRAGLEFLAAEPSFAHLLLVESLAAAHPARPEYERRLARLAKALRPPAELSGSEVVSEEALQLLAGGLASHLSGRVLAGEAERLGDDHDPLLEYLLASSLVADVRVAAG